MSHEIEWDCQACGSQVEVLGQLGNRLHGRCRGCGLDQSCLHFVDVQQDFTHDPYEGLSDDVTDALGQRPTLPPGPNYPHALTSEDGPHVADFPNTHCVTASLLEENDEPFANDWKPRP